MGGGGGCAATVVLSSLVESTGSPVFDSLESIIINILELQRLTVIDGSR